MTTTTVTATLDFAGQIGVKPRLGRLVTNGTYANITAPGFLNTLWGLASQVQPTDYIFANYNGGSGIFTPVFSGETITLNSNGFLRSIVTLNQSQVQNMYATPVLLIPAAGANTVILPNDTTLYTSQSVAFSGGGAISVQWGNSNHGAGPLALASTFAASVIEQGYSLFARVTGLNSNNTVENSVANTGLYVSNASGAFGGGNAAATVTFVTNYQILVANV